MIKMITPFELNEKMKKESVLLVDVRENDEHVFEHIQGDVHISLGSLTLQKLIHTDKTIVFYCKSGMRSQSAALKIVETLKNNEIYSLHGGIENWKTSNLPVIRQSTTIPIMRQVMIIAGFLNLTGVLLGKSGCDICTYIPGIIGMGLLFAGLSGWCGMALILNKMPWNK